MTKKLTVELAAEIQRQLHHGKFTICGRCPNCQVFRYGKDEIREEERDETCLYVCRACNGVLDVNEIPF